MKNIVLAALSAALFTSASVNECKKDTSGVRIKSKQDSTAKRPVLKRPLYQRIFMI
jgi:hypothetical protein